MRELIERARAYDLPSADSWPLFRGVKVDDEIKISRGRLEMVRLGDYVGLLKVRVRAKDNKILIQPTIQLALNKKHNFLHTLYHELIHLEQVIRLVRENRRRLIGRWEDVEEVIPEAYDYDASNDAEYYADPMEMEAYSQEVIFILKEMGRLDDLKELIKTPLKFKKLVGVKAVRWYLTKAPKGLKRQFIKLLRSHSLTQRATVS